MKVLSGCGPVRFLGVAFLLGLLALAGGARVGSSAGVTWAGHWAIVDHGTAGAATGNDYPWSVTLVQSGGTLTSLGTPTPYVVKGSASGLTAHFVASAGGYQAPFTVTMSADGKTFKGTWTDNQGNAGTAVGTRTGGGAALPKLPPLPGATNPTGRITDAVGMAGISVERDGKLYAISRSSTLQTGDIIRTGSSSILTFEFLIGGRVGVNRNTAVTMINERSASDVPSLSVSQNLARAGTGIVVLLTRGTDTSSVADMVIVVGGANGVAIRG